MDDAIRSLGAGAWTGLPTQQKDNSARRNPVCIAVHKGETLESPVTVSISVLKDTVL